MEIGVRSELVDIINYCVDHQVHQSDPSARDPKPLIGCFGRLKKYKSIEHLLQAMVLVRKQHPDVKLIIVGEGDNRSALEALAKELRIQDAVQFTGFIEEDEKVRWLQRVWFAVNTSSKEGWGLTVIEANACGTTVIASNVPGLRDAVKHNDTGLLYEFGNVQELAEQIHQCLADPALRDRLAQSARAWAATFDWDIAAGRTLKLLEQRVHSSS